ncbi:MAG: alpha-D-glucose phosphate-specific phosphoglucomutase, partial [Prochlorococcus sp.]
MNTSAQAEPTQRQVLLNTPFTDQKPGTSGLRKSSQQFEQPNYLESFIEAILLTLPGVQGGTLVLGGDGRYGNRRAIDVILRMGAAHGLKRVITTTDGILSTPAASHLIRSKKAIGGIILSASHNQGGPDGDFGVKVNGANGGPASESLTNAIYASSQTLEKYSLMDAPAVPLATPGHHVIGAMAVDVIDGV